MSSDIHMARRQSLREEVVPPGALTRSIGRSRITLSRSGGGKRTGPTSEGLIEHFGVVHDAWSSGTRAVERPTAPDMSTASDLVAAASDHLLRP